MEIITDLPTTGTEYSRLVALQKYAGSRSKLMLGYVSPSEKVNIIILIKKINKNKTVKSILK